MPYSMTGFGRVDLADGNWQVGVEVKTVNHRYSDIALKLPKILFIHEAAIRQAVTAKLARGRVDVYINITPVGQRPYSHHLNWGLVETYVHAANELADRHGINAQLSAEFLLNLSDVLAVEEETVDQELLWNVIAPALDQALQQVVQMRRTEGQRLSQDMLYRLELIEQSVNRISERSPVVVADYSARLTERMSAFLQEGVLDHDRIAAEAAIFADKSNITEEIIRLISHLTETRILLQESEQIGRKLDFIIQELNREINTIGSKANDEVITSEVIYCKAEIEKIREQAQNLE